MEETIRRDLIEVWLERYTKASSLLNETHPPGDPMIADMWALATTNLENGVDTDQGMEPCPDEECRANRAAQWVAAAILVANYGPDYVQDAGVRAR